MNKKELTYNQVKKYVKDNISFLEDYSLGEEEILIEQTLNLRKNQLIFKTFSDKEFNKIKKIVKKRKEGKPLNRIFNNCFFYKDNFKINKNVLSPRQETELLVDNALKFISTLNKKCVKVLDLCCGSGIIGLSIAKHSSKNCFVVLSDISSKALRVAKKNARIIGVEKNTKFLKSNLFNSLKVENKFDIILSNPPYIETSTIQNLNYSVKNFDPLIALDGGRDGLDFYKKISAEAKEYLNEFGIVILEIGFNQKKAVETLFSNNNFAVKCIKDFSNNDRVIMAKYKEVNKNDW